MNRFLKPKCAKFHSPNILQRFNNKNFQNLIVTDSKKGENLIW